MKDKKSASLFQKEQVMESLKQSFVKLNPRVMIKNPIMFTVELVTLVMLVVCILSLGTSEYGTFGYNFLVFVILFVTLLFANFAEAIAEACVRRVRKLPPRFWWRVSYVLSAAHVSRREISLFAKPAIRFLPMVRLWKDWLLLTRVPLPVNLLR